ncbi:MAG TPA: Holliday junction resolvase RuvX [Ktedonobacteraceae bacterium]|nr:Holliday junction resolvase RuvX [Ktedonobacteraceae bacterium]
MSRIPGEPSAGRVLAIDYGRKRLGLALSDALGVTARPLATWSRSKRRQDMARLRSLCREQEIKQIVVGWPLQLSGSHGEMAAEAARFAERVHKELSIPVELIDERLSSWEARQALEESAGKARSRNRGQHELDEVAAAVILRDYLRRTSGTT